MDKRSSQALNARRLHWHVSLLVLGFALAGLILGHWLGGEPSAAVDAAASARPLPWLAGALVFVGVAVAWLLKRHAIAGDIQVRDPVSGLYRRQHGDEFIRVQLAREDRSGVSRLALVLIRIDYLQDVRRRYGGAAADRVVGLVGCLVSDQTRGGDLAVRHAEDLLAVYLDCAEIEQAQAFGRRISMLLMSQQLDWHGDVIKVDVSLGIAQRTPGEDPEHLFERALRGFRAARPR